MWERVACLVLLIGCSEAAAVEEPASGSSTGSEQPASSVASPSTRAHSAFDRRPVPRCGPSEATPLANLAQVHDGGRYVTEVARNAQNEWLPTPFPSMPMHHASRLEWVNIEAFSELADSPYERLRFEFELRSHEVQQVPGAHQWRAVYRCELVAICQPDADD
ncbi:MAG: hypothetical protein AAGF12_15230 [Myxococcota bacterium]